MRIVHVIGSLSGGGAETQAKLLLRGLADRGHSVGVVFLRDDETFVNRDGITFLQVERGRKWNLWGLFRRVGSAVKKYEPDVVHTWLPEIMTIPGALQARLLCVPCVSAQRRSLRHTVSFAYRVRDWLVVLPHLLSRRVVCNFEWSREPLLLRKIIEVRRGVVIRNAVAPPLASSSQPLDWLRKNAFKVLYVGRLVEQKRVELLIEAVARLRNEGIDVQLGICGEGVLESRLRAWAEKCGLRGEDDIGFLGYRPEWRGFCNQFDVFVLPSVAEGMPNVLTEAMASGLPTIATRVFEIESFVRDRQNCILVTPESVVSLMNGIREVALDEKMRMKIAASGKGLAASMAVGRMVDEYICLYEELVEGKRREGGEK